MPPNALKFLRHLLDRVADYCYDVGRPARQLGKIEIRVLTAQARRFNYPSDEKILSEKHGREERTKCQESK
jgi:hypothetical protein